MKKVVVHLNDGSLLKGLMCKYLTRYADEKASRIRRQRETLDIDRLKDYYRDYFNILLDDDDIEDMLDEGCVPMLDDSDFMLMDKHSRRESRRERNKRNSSRGSRGSKKKNGNHERGHDVDYLRLPFDGEEEYNEDFDPLNDGYESDGKTIYFYHDLEGLMPRDTFHSLQAFDDYCNHNGINVDPYDGRILADNDIVYCAISEFHKEVLGKLVLIANPTFHGMLQDAKAHMSDSTSTLL